jgi:hypothetical protein
VVHGRGAQSQAYRNAEEATSHAALIRGGMMKRRALDENTQLVIRK